MLIIYSTLIALAVLVIITALKIVEFRENSKRRAQGLPPLTEENLPIEVIDWTQRKR